jgi:hypothetical protein
MVATPSIKREFSENNKRGIYKKRNINYQLMLKQHPNIRPGALEKIFIKKVRYASRRMQFKQ